MSKFIYVLAVVIMFSYAADAKSQSDDQQDVVYDSVSMRQAGNLKQELSLCTQEYEQNEDTAISSAASGNSHLLYELNRERIKCYNQVAWRIFTELYPEQRRQMEKSFDDFLQKANVFTGNALDYNKSCYSEKNKFSCGTITTDLQIRYQAEIINAALSNILEYTISRSK